MANDMWKRIFRHLVSEGFDVYPPGKHEGECSSYYLVLNDGGSGKVIGGGYKLFNISLYVPLNEYSEIEGYANHIKRSMKKLLFLRHSGNDTPIIINEKFKAHEQTLEYIVMKRM